MLKMSTTVQVRAYCSLQALGRQQMQTFLPDFFYQHFRYFNSKIKFLVKIGRGKLGQLRKSLITYKYIARGLVTERILSLIFLKCLLLCKKKTS
jgi:hypothetical protein